MPGWLQSRTVHYPLLMAVGACLLLINLGGPALWDIDEGRNATATQEMLDSGDWIKPTFNGKLRSHKPALLYWLQMTAVALLGSNEFAIRLPSALAGLATILLVYELARKMFRPSTGLIAGLMLASSTLFCVATHFANPDALLLVCTTAALAAFWFGFTAQRRGWFLAAGAAAGLGALAKGPVGVVLPAAAIASFLFWGRRWNLLFSRTWLQSFLVCMAVAAPWYILVSVETKQEFISEFLLSHNLERALTPMEQHSGPWWYYIAVLAVGLSPWSIYIVATAWCSTWSAFRAPGARLQTIWSSACDQQVPAAGGEASESYRFLACWIGIYLLAFTIAATKLPNYILPVVGPSVILIARMLDRWRAGEWRLPTWAHCISLSVLGLIGTAIALALLSIGGALSLNPFHGRVFPELVSWAWLGAIPLLGAPAGLWCLLRGRRNAYVALLIAVAVAYLSPLAAGVTAVVSRHHAPRALVEASSTYAPSDEIRVVRYQLDFLPSLNFYVHRYVHEAEKEAEVVDWLKQPLPVYVFLQRSDWERIEPSVRSPHRIAAAHTELYKSGELLVVTNR
jgi:4-amino-4-deoxy-L-arabinose transferase-like glycosyltransferase